MMNHHSNNEQTSQHFEISRATGEGGGGGREGRIAHLQENKGTIHWFEFGTSNNEIFY